MKKIYLLSFLLLAVITAGAQNKRLSKITLAYSSSEESATMTYDSQDRVTQILLNRRGGKTSTATLSYEGSDKIKISHQYNSGTDTYTYTLSNGRILTEEIFLDVDMVNYTNTFEYTGSTITNVYVTQTVNNKTKNMKHEYTWSGGNVIEDKFYYQGELETLSTCTPGSISAHPLVSALFCVGNGKPKDIVDELMPLLGTYQYMGTMPEKPYSRVDIYDYYDKKSTIYNYDYALNAEGDVVQVTVTKEGSTSSSYPRTYTLEWEGSSTPPSTDITPSETGKQDFGNGGSIDGNTNLNGNVVGNVYYNIASGGGGYNAVEGCIEITKPTDDSAIEGKDIFGEDFKNHFTGIVFKVAAGKGTVKVNAQTAGSMMIKVKVGSNEPNEMMLTGKVEAKFPYNVTEPTYVFVYASSFTGSAPGRASAAGSDVLRIYGLSWDDTAGIDELNSDASRDTPVYNLRGQRLAAPQKGINIIGGRKVVVK